MDLLWHGKNSCHNYINVIFTIYETLFENVITILPITYQIKLKFLEKIRSAWFIYKKFHIVSTMYKLFEYNFLCNCFSLAIKWI